MPSPHPKTAVLLAGGRSNRMGADKFLMELNGKPQWEFMVEQLNLFFDEVFIACRRDQAHYFEGQQLIFDELEDIGPMGALYSTFQNLEGVSPIFFVACDLPYFSSSLSAKLHSELSNDYDIVAAYNPKRKSTEPLVAYWSRSAFPLINQFIANENYALFKCMSQLSVKAVDVADQHALRNVNTPSDL